jgi:Flp pilus assembly protein TadG
LRDLRAYGWAIAVAPIIHNRRKHPSSNGQGLVEFALVLMPLLVMMMGVFDLGRGIFAYNEVANAAREGGRTAIVNQVVSDIRARAAAQAVALGIPTAVPGVCPTTGGPPTGATDTAGICVAFVDPTDPTKVCSPVVSGCVAVVSVKYTFTPVTPIIGTIIGPLSVTSTTHQVIEAACSVVGACTSP